MKRRPTLSLKRGADLVGPERLQKLLSKAGLGSRRMIEERILARYGEILAAGALPKKLRAPREAAEDESDLAFREGDTPAAIPPVAAWRAARRAARASAASRTDIVDGSGPSPTATRASRTRRALRARVPRARAPAPARTAVALQASHAPRSRGVATA